MGTRLRDFPTQSVGTQGAPKPLGSQGGSGTCGCQTQSVTTSAMLAKIIAVGSELLTPDRLDANSLFLTSELDKVRLEDLPERRRRGTTHERIAFTISPLPSLIMVLTK